MGSVDQCAGDFVKSGGFPMQTPPLMKLPRCWDLQKRYKTVFVAYLSPFFFTKIFHQSSVRSLELLDDSSPNDFPLHYDFKVCELP